MKKINILIILLTLLACSNKKMSQTDISKDKCDLEIAKGTCLRYLDQHKLGVSDPKIDISDTLNMYIVEIYPKSTLVKGGGGKFKVSKEKCEIFDIELYQ